MHTATTHNEAVRALFHGFVDEVINGRDLDRALAELVAQDLVEQNPLPGQGPGRAGLGDVLAGMFAGFPDLRWDVQETVVEADRVASCSFWTGTHQGEFLGIPATGRSVKVEAWNLDRFQDGQLTESRHPGPRRELTGPSRHSERLGLEPVATIPSATSDTRRAESSSSSIRPSSPEGNQVTAAGFSVKDFDEVVAFLRSNGVVFEHVDFGETEATVDGVITTPDGQKAAWFKDSEGNTFALSMAD